MDSATRELAKAYLQELDAKLEHEKPSGKKVTVQFNPETIKVSYSNQLQPSGDQTNGNAAKQFVGAGTTKLNVQLWFDITAPVSEAATPAGAVPGQSVDDVRKLTKEVAHFITPQKDPDDPKKNLPPGVRFVWGSFQFDGMMESLEESLEFFSYDGKPLRASVTVSLTQQKIQFAFAETKPRSGTTSLSKASGNATFQGMADLRGKGAQWQQLAELNSIENPRFLQPGQFVNLNVKLPRIQDE
jgi:hypothetical protein